MNSKKLSLWILISILVAMLLAGCGGGAPAQPTATATSIPPTATSIPPTAASVPPAAGEWIAATDFGKLVFTVDSTGAKITKMSYQFSKWTCGPTTNSGTIEVGSEWPITDGKFSVNESFDPDKKQTMTFGGTYDAANQKFSGKWAEISYGTNCSGTWEATAPK